MFVELQKSLDPTEKTRWHAEFYNSLSIKNAFTKYDFKFQKEYAKLMKPLAEATDDLQGEFEC